MNYWILKTEPSTYSMDDLVRDKTTEWTGVRNHQAKNNLAAMKRGDLVYIFHTGDERSLVGTATVLRVARADPTSDEVGWLSVSIGRPHLLPRTVTASELKAHLSLQTLPLLRQGRLSVSPVSAREHQVIQRLARKDDQAKAVRAPGTPAL